jgi:UDP-sulfoquinovose synthase
MALGDKEDDMRITVYGADGYIGWPMALHLAALGHEVTAVDNLARRRWDAEGGTSSLNPIASFEERIELWNSLGHGKPIARREFDICEYEAVLAQLEEDGTEAVVHFGEQRSAPFSMISREHAVRTQVNNIVGTLNILFAIREVNPEIHLVKLGSMGEYGTPNIDIEEGFLTITHNGRTDTLPYPKLPHSFYHLSKVADSYNIHFTTRVWNLRATDLNQGVVYGVATDETALDPRLATRFDYDSTWGTALNRFTIQAALGYPITVYGRGGQTRGYLDIRDTMACITLALENPPKPSQYRVFNQFTEQFTLNQLAETVARVASTKGLEPKIVHLENPRIEKEEHYYNAKHSALLDLGLKPHYLADTLIESLVDFVQANANNVDVELLERPTTTWREGATEVWHRHADPALVAEHGAMEATRTIRKAAES